MAIDAGMRNRAGAAEECVSCAATTDAASKTAALDAGEYVMRNVSTSWGWYRLGAQAETAATFCVYGGVKGRPIAPGEAVWISLGGTDSNDAVIDTVFIDLAPGGTGVLPIWQPED